MINLKKNNNNKYISLSNTQNLLYGHTITIIIIIIIIII